MQYPNYPGYVFSSFELKDHIRRVPQLDWIGLQNDLGTDEMTPTGILHELLHVYDCTGNFTPVGNRKAVETIINKTHKTLRSMNDSEIRVSAIEYLVANYYGQNDRIDNYWIDAYTSIMTDSSLVQVQHRFIKMLTSKKVRAMVDATLGFLKPYELSESGNR